GWFGAGGIGRGQHRTRLRLPLRPLRGSPVEYPAPEVLAGRPAARVRRGRGGRRPAVRTADRRCVVAARHRAVRDRGAFRATDSGTRTATHGPVESPGVRRGAVAVRTGFLGGAAARARYRRSRTGIM